MSKMNQTAVINLGVFRCSSTGRGQLVADESKGGSRRRDRCARCSCCYFLASAASALIIVASAFIIFACAAFFFAAATPPPVDVTVWTKTTCREKRR